MSTQEPWPMGSGDSPFAPEPRPMGSGNVPGTPELRPMGIGDILDTTFRLYRQRFLTFLLIALVVYVPFGLFMGLLQAMLPTPQPFVVAPAPPGAHAPNFPARQGNRQPYPEINPAAAFTALLVPLVFVMVFALVLVPLCSAALIENISASYLGETLPAGASYARAAPRLVPLLWTQLLAGLVIGLGYLMCIVPGIYFSLWFLVIAPVVILERANGSTAMGRSRELMRGNVGKGFLVMLVVGLLSGVINAALGAVIGLIPWPHVAFRGFFENVLPALTLPIQTAPLILLYYDLRIRKEAFDLQMLSEALGQPAAT